MNFFLSIAAVLAGSSFLAGPKTATEVFEIASKSSVIVLAYDREGEVSGLGSGVVLPDGDVATNCHVIESAARVSIYHQKREYSAATRHTDWARDVCTLTSSDLKVPPVTLGSSHALRVGARVYAIGAPRGLELTLSEGIVSGLRDVDGGRYIQITAPISPGSSGGGLFDEQARLLGLTNFYLAEGQNLNFALPVEWLAELPKRHAAKAQREPVQTSWVFRAVQLEATGDWQEAVDHARRWTEAMPESTRAWFHLGFAYLQRGEPAKAVEAYRHALRIDPEDAFTWEKLGEAYVRSGETGKALEAYQEAVRIDPWDLNLWTILGDAFGDSGQWSKAIEVYQQAVRIDPEDARARYERLAGAHGQSGQWAESLKASMKAGSVETEYAHAWRSLAFAYGETGQFGRAVDAYRRVLRIVPDDHVALFSLGVAYQKSGRTAEAIQAYRRALEINSENAWLWWSLGEAYSESGRTAEAIQAYEGALRTDPEHSWSWISLGDEYMTSARFAQAIEAFRQALRIDPNKHHSAWRELGALYAHLGQTAQALDAYRQSALRSSPPEDGDAWYQLCHAYTSLSDQWVEAIKACQQAVRIDPENARAWYALGHAYWATGQSRKVMEVHERLRTISPFMADVFFQIFLLP